MAAFKMPDDPLDLDEVIERIDAAVEQVSNNKGPKINLRKTQAAFRSIAEEACKSCTMPDCEGCQA